MKTKSRFIVILAALSLFIAMLPIGPAGAATGTVAFDETFYSDKDGFNIVTIAVTDSDLSAGRIGTARYNVAADTIATDGADPDPFTLKTTGGNTYGLPIIGGEKDRTETFSGSILESGTVTTASGVTLTDMAADFVTERVAIGDVVTNTTDGCSGAVAAVVDLNNLTVECRGGTLGTWTLADAYTILDATFILTETPRDADEDGVLEAAGTKDDDVQVTVGGSTVAAADYTIDYVTKILVLATAAPAVADNVVITYEISEYDQTTPANTPLRLFGTSVKFGTSLAGASNEVGVALISFSAGTVTTTIDVPANQVVVVTFVYDVTDTIADNITITSNTSVAAGKNRQLAGVETGAATDIFESKVALITSSDLGLIESESADTANDEIVNGGDDNGKVEIDELNNTADLGVTVALSDALNARVMLAAGRLGLVATDALASDLLKQLLPVADADTLTGSYADASPSATIEKTATADLAAPVVTLVTPVNKVFTDQELVTLVADVVDEGAGVDPGAIGLVKSTGITGGAPITPPILNGFRLSFAPTSAITQGPKTWAITVEDKVGNTPDVDDAATTDVNEGALGAAPTGTPIGSVDNPFKFTVDTNGPEVIDATTGLYLKNPGVTSGTTKESQSSNKTTMVRLLFDLGTGTAPIDPASVTASDFRVAGILPISATVNTVAHESGGIIVGSAVYLEVTAQETDARPKVELVGDITDEAGNVRTSGTISAAGDKLKPVLTVSPSAALGEKDVTVTVTSSEALVINPTIEVTTTEPSIGDLLGTTPLTVTSTGTKSWTAKYSNPTGASSEQWVVVSGTDVPGNSSILGDDSPTDDLFSFEVDDADPVVAFQDAAAAPIATTDQEEGAIWLVSVFDEDEYTGDSYKKVTVTALSLTDEDGVVVTSDVNDLFTSDSISYTLAVSLTPGDYSFEITAEDSAANEVTDDVDFTVVKRVPFDLDLKPGVNLVSIPGTPIGDGGNINILLEGLPVTAVVTYDRSLDIAGANPWLTSTLDAETGLFTGDISVLEPGKAYFITATASTTAEILIGQPSMVLPPTIGVRQGFNAIGFWSISGATTADIDAYLNSIKWTVAYVFDPTPGIGWTVIRPDGNTDDDITNDPAVADGVFAAGEIDDALGSGTGDLPITEGTGYLVFVIEDGTLTP